MTFLDKLFGVNREKKIATRNVPCVLCGEGITTKEEYFWNDFLGFWEKENPYHLNICQKCQNARNIIDEENRREWITHRDKLIKMKGGKVK